MAGLAGCVLSGWKAGRRRRFPSTTQLLEWAEKLASVGRECRASVPKAPLQDAQQMPALAEKLHPGRFTEMSPCVAAIAGYVLGESWTNPAIAEITVSEAEDLVYIRKAGGVGFDGV